MNRKETKELLAEVDAHREAMEAYANGEEIEEWNSYRNDWITVTECPSFSLETLYRVLSKPGLRPFNAEELADLVGCRLRHKKTKQTVIVQQHYHEMLNVLLSNSVRIKSHILLKAWELITSDGVAHPLGEITSNQPENK